MKKQLSVFLLFVVVCFSACCHSEKPAQLVFSQDSIDLGTVIIGDDPKLFDVEIYNKGSQKLIINKVETTCDCTTVEFPHDSIEGGGSAVMHVSFDGKDFFPSEMVRDIQVFSNSEDSPQTFYFKVKVQYGSARNDQCGTYNVYTHS